jgi:DNA-binding ferritin-like protein
MERIEELCCLYLSHLRAINLIHQQSHWIVKGANSYGQHLLFERIYKSSVDDADLAAEKLVGVFGEDSIDFQAQTQLISKLLEKSATETPNEASLQAEKRFLAFSQKFSDALEAEGKMTLGVGDMLQSIASKREEACYLLQQSFPEQKDDLMNSKMAARKTFLNRVAQSTDIMEQEKKALSQLKMQISSVLATLAKGHANFQVQMRRETPSMNGGGAKYSLSVAISENSPEAAARDALEKALPSIVARVPYFAGKVGQARVILLS